MTTSRSVWHGPRRPPSVEPVSPGRLFPAIVATAVLCAAAAGCSPTPQPVETRLPPGLEAQTPRPTVAVPSPTVVTLSPAPSATAVPAPSGGAGGADVLECGGGENQSVAGSERSVQITGTCGELTVSGSAIVIDASRATITTLRISGDRAQVSAGALGSVVVQGNDGLVTSSASIDSVDVSGDRTRIEATGDISAVTVRGQDNVVRSGGTVGSTVVEGRGNQIG